MSLTPFGAPATRSDWTENKRTSSEGLTGHAARLRIRAGSYRGSTAGMAAGYVQGNVVCLPRDWAFEFMQYCIRNPQPCPLLAVSEPGDWRLPRLGEDLDVRTDLPSYRIWRDGKVESETTDVRELWRPDLVTFVLGCSFSFDSALAEAGVTLRYLENGGAAPAFVTRIPTVSAGRFSGPLVVTMRPLIARDAIRAILITSRYPDAHGAPVHIGSPSQIGIDDISKPDYGAPIEVRDTDIPVFWACGLTPFAALAAAAPPFCITHGPAAMLITDLRLLDCAVS